VEKRGSRRKKEDEPEENLMSHTGEDGGTTATATI